MSDNRSIINKRHGVNAIDGEQLQIRKRKMLKTVCNVIRPSMGPYGGNTLIADPYATTPVSGSKDGYRIMLNIQFDDMIDNALFQITRDSSLRMNTLVGDSTSSVNIIIYVLDLILSLLSKSTEISDDDVEAFGFDDDVNKVDEIIRDKPGVRVTPFAVKSILNAVEDKLIKILKEKYIIPISHFSDMDVRRMIYEKVATVAANNDTSIGKMVASIFTEAEPGEEIFVDINKSPDDETYIEKAKGFSLGSGYLNDAVINMADGMTCQYGEAKVLVLSGPLTFNDMQTVYDLLTVLKTAGEAKAKEANKPTHNAAIPLVIFAQEIDTAVEHQILKLRNGIPMRDGTTFQAPIAVVGLDTSSVNATERARDLAASIGATLINTRKGKIIEFTEAEKDNPSVIMKFLGTVGQIKVTRGETKIRDGRGDEDKIAARIDAINEKIRVLGENKDIDSVGDINILRRRIGMLKSNMSEIKVGGRSYKEKDSMFYFFEDAVYALKSVLKNGVAMGGNVSVSHAIAENFETILEEVVEDLIANDASILFSNKKEDIAAVVRYTLNGIGYSFLSAYRCVIMAATEKEEVVKDIIENKLGYIYSSEEKQFKANNEEPQILNLKTGEYESLSGLATDNKLIVAGNTDLELIRTAFSVCSTFLTANQLMAHPIVFNHKNQQK